MPSTVYRGSLRPFLVSSDGVPLPARSTPDELAPGEHSWTKEGITFRPEPGMQRDDFTVYGTVRMAGVAISGASYVHVRNLICEFFANDGFNIHGSCMGMVFQNIEGRFNGDDGFSVHEDVGATVLGGYFHHNSYGIQDVNASRSVFNGVLVEHNRLHGIHFNGGYHSVVDAIVRDNGTDQVRIDSNTAAHLGFRPDNPFCTGTVFLHNIAVKGGRAGIRATGLTRVTITHARVWDAVEGIVLQDSTAAHVLGSAVSDCGTRELSVTSPNVAIDASVFFPGRIRWQGADYTADTAAALADTTETLSALAFLKPVSRSENGFMLAQPTILFNDRELRPGLTREPDLPAKRAAAPTADAGPDQLMFDFEHANPWCRLYPVPEKNAAGAAVVTEAALSTDQAHSGASSLKVTAALPPAPPENWTIKLFSIKFLTITRPVTALSFAMFGSAENQGLAFRPRIRDRSGECFYGPRQRVDWSGWKIIGWDLTETPPDPISAGDGNREQDAPPIEIVLELYATAGPDGGQITLLLDDLSIQLQPAE
jgi:hypothetical protein